MWDLPGPGIEPMSPALAGGFLTTEPTGKSHYHAFNMYSLNPWSSGNFSFQSTNKQFQSFFCLFLACLFHTILTASIQTDHVDVSLFFVIASDNSLTSPPLKPLCRDKIYILHDNDVMNLPTTCHFLLICLSIPFLFRKIQDLPQFFPALPLPNSLILLTYMDPLNKPDESTHCHPTKHVYSVSIVTAHTIFPSGLIFSQLYQILLKF